MNINGLISKPVSCQSSVMCFQTTFRMKPHERLDHSLYVPPMSWDFMFQFHENHILTLVAYGNIYTYIRGKFKTLVTNQ